jgi:hypothetical protein
VEGFDLSTRPPFEQHPWDRDTFANLLAGRPRETYSDPLTDGRVDPRSFDYCGPFGQERYYADRNQVSHEQAMVRRILADAQTNAAVQAGGLPPQRPAAESSTAPIVTIL